MAISPSSVKEHYKNLSIEELEKRYEELKKEYIFNSKEELIKDVIDNYLFASRSVNNNSTRQALEELLKEKTGKDYSFEPTNFEITLEDVINYIVNPAKDPFWTRAITEYFDKLKIDEEDKMYFLIELVQDKNTFNDFTREIIQNSNAEEVYNKYKDIIRQYISRNMLIG